MNNFKSFLAISLKDKLLLIEAVLFLFVAKILLLILPFKYCMRFLSDNNFIESARDINYLSAIKIAMTRANRLAFWKNLCLVQSVAARWMLQRRKIKSTLSFGVIFDKDQKLTAHAWLNVADFEVVPKEGDYKVLYTF